MEVCCSSLDRTSTTDLMERCSTAYLTIIKRLRASHSHHESILGTPIETFKSMIRTHAEFLAIFEVLNLMTRAGLNLRHLAAGVSSSYAWKLNFGIRGYLQQKKAREDYPSFGEEPLSLYYLHLLYIHSLVRHYWLAMNAELKLRLRVNEELHMLVKEETGLESEQQAADMDKWISEVVWDGLEAIVGRPKLGAQGLRDVCHKSGGCNRSRSPRCGDIDCIARFHAKRFVDLCETLVLERGLIRNLKNARSTMRDTLNDGDDGSRLDMSLNFFFEASYRTFYRVCTSRIPLDALEIMLRFHLKKHMAYKWPEAI